MTKELMPDTTLAPKVWIKDITFSDNTKISFDKADMIVFVGPNNAGKSVALKDIMTLMENKSISSKVVKEVGLSKSGSEIDYLNLLDSVSKKSTPNNDLYYSGLNYQIHAGSITNLWNQADKTLTGGLRGFFANLLSTEQRLVLANPAVNLRLTQDPANHPIHVIAKSDSLEYQFSNYFKQAFGQDLILHHGAGNEIPFYVGQRPIPQKGEDRISEGYLNELEKLDRLNDQGDGMKSFVGVLLTAFVSQYSVLLIDEPEAFLHPPQARLLGKMLAYDLPADRQLFISTHSIDFLQGLLSSNKKNIKIVRIQRNELVNKISILDSQDISEIWSDSLLRHSNILDGLFHKQVVICESDSDCRFYSAILDAIYDKENLAPPDVLFIHCNGKHRIHTAVSALKNLGVTVKVIVDVDILNEEKTIERLYNSLGGDWAELKKRWQILKQQVDQKRPQLNTEDLKKAINEELSSVVTDHLPNENAEVIKKLLKAASPWKELKSAGRSFLPSGDSILAFDEIIKKGKNIGLYIVENGELESFDRSHNEHGPLWVAKVLEDRDLSKSPELEAARIFVAEFIGS